MRNQWKHGVAVAVFGLAAAFPAQAADWVPVTQIGDNVREIDTSSIVGQLPIVTYTTRHVFGDLNEYRVGRRGIKYLVISGKADCRHRTTAKLAVDAYDENMSLVSKQVIQDPDETMVTPESIEEAVLKYVCNPK